MNLLVGSKVLCDLFDLLTTPVLFIPLFFVHRIFCVRSDHTPGGGEVIRSKK
jgi:hypothetical protein